MIEPGLGRLTYALHIEGLCPQELVPEQPELAEQYGLVQPKVAAQPG
jgi:hypothetical protein